MNILYCGDRPMQKGILLSVLSIIDNVKEPLNVYILTVDYSEQGNIFKPIENTFAEFLEEILKKSDIKSEVTLIDITRFFVEELPQANMQTRFTACCMLRLFADKVDIPDRVLYLDTDVLCRRDFSQFYYQDMTGVEIAGVSDYYGRWLFGDGYINSGVMLMNMETIRATNLLGKCREQCMRKEMFMPDQTAINTFSTGINLSGRRFNDQRRLHDNTVFQHFTTTFRVFPLIKTVTVKPWEIEKMHNVLGLHEYDGLLSRFEEAYSQYRERTRIPIFFSVNEGYTLYLAVCLESLAQNSSKTEQYRIIVLYDDVKTITRIKLANVVKDYSNITIEFVEINKGMESITDRMENRLYSGVFTLTIYFRLFIAELFPEIEKGIYIDSDTVLTSNIAELFGTDLDGKMFGAVRDTFVAKDRVLSGYVQKAIGIDRDSYVNSGVLLMNMKKMREEHLSDKFIKLLDKYHFDSIAPDQDYINAICAGDIYYLDREWNVMPNKGGEYVDRPKLVHFNLFDKPWHYKDIPYEEYFWHYALRSGFYPELVRQQAEYTEEQKREDREKLDELLERAGKISCTGVRFADILGKSHNVKKVV